MKPILFIMLLIPLLSHAEQWHTNGNPAPKESHQGSVNEFGAMILMTTDSKKVLENWSKPTAGVHIPDTNKVMKGNPIEALVLFSGCAVNEHGNCVTEVDYKIIKPNGEVYAEYKNTELWRNKPALPKGRLGLAVDRVGLIAEPEDPFGTYKVSCLVKDLVAGSKFNIYSTFEVIEANKSLNRTLGADAPPAR